MSAIRGKGNKSTEVKMRMMLVKNGISGFVLHNKELPGKPDFFFQGSNIALFTDGCYWHGCPFCRCSIPKTRTKWWQMKISGNKKRDRRTNSRLKKMGIRVIRTWECQLRQKKKTRQLINKLKILLDF
jgi:DNA mismatch endonuclease (patch repair protein)